MFLSIMNVSLDNPSALTVGLILIVSLVFGLAMMTLYGFCYRERGYEKSFAVTLLILPVVITIIIMLVANNIARAFSLAGIFTLVKFRNTIDNPRDISFIFITVALGLAMGTGAIGYGIILFAIVAIVFVILHLLKLDTDGPTKLKLKIMIPENMSYEQTFVQVFKKHVSHYRLVKVKTSDFGTMFELTYLVNVKPEFNQKKFIDDIRARNGNLDVVMTSYFDECTS